MIDLIIEIVESILTTTIDHIFLESYVASITFGISYVILRWAFRKLFLKLSSYVRGINVDRNAIVASIFFSFFFTGLIILSAIYFSEGASILFVLAWINFSIVIFLVFASTRDSWYIVKLREKQFICDISIHSDNLKILGMIILLVSLIWGVINGEMELLFTENNSQILSLALYGMTIAGIGSILDEI